MTKSAKQILIEARGKVSPKEAWAIGSTAKDRSGELVSPSSELACAWCMWGAIDASANTWPEVNRALTALARVTGGEIGEFNDTHTHAEVLAAFDRAIAIA